MMHHTGVAFLKIVTKGLLQCFTFGVVPGVLVDGLVDGGEGLCKDIWANWGQDRKEQERQQAIQAIAQVSAEELREVVAALVADVAVDFPEQQPQLKSLLTQVQANIRRTLRRPDDPRGVTSAPRRMFDSPRSLLPLLPHKLARFQSGDRPLPGVDLQLVELLGIGGFGEVWQAINPNMPHSPPVALKFCLDPTAAKTLRNEAALLNHVRQHGKHPGIVELKHTYLSADPAALEYEYVAGGDLTDLIRNAPGGLVPAEAREIIRELAETMAFAHQSGIVHRDLKPANILVPSSTQPGERRFKIADFGIGSLQAGIASRATRGHTVGQRLAESLIGSHTPLYSSLEQARGDEPHTADDVFSLGVIWYQLLFGDLNEGAPTSRRWPDKLRARGTSAAEIELLADCFEARNDRPRSARELIERLELVASRTDARQKPVEPLALLIAPFDVLTAQRSQADWAWHLGLPIELTNSLRMKLTLIPAGQFEMGNRMSEQQLAAKFAKWGAVEEDFKGEFRSHWVEISLPFYLGQHEVTVGQFRRFVNDEGYQTEAETDGYGYSVDKTTGDWDLGWEYSWRNPGFTQTDEHPVVNVTWNDAQQFCNWLSRKEGKSYRLPTEAEWEYACKAGTNSLWWNGDDPETVAKIGNIDDGKAIAKFDPLTAVNAGNGLLFTVCTAPVGKFQANPFGLFDMHGNVWEWCQDVYDAEASRRRMGLTFLRSIFEPPETSGGVYRVLRGGSWSFGPHNSGPHNSRSAFRTGSFSDFRLDSVGFRVARTC